MSFVVVINMNSEDLSPYADLYLDRKMEKKGGKSYEVIRCQFTESEWQRELFRSSLQEVAKKVGSQKIKIVLLGAHGKIGGCDFFVYQNAAEMRIPAREMARTVQECFSEEQVIQGKIYCCWSGMGEPNLASLFAQEGRFPTIGFRNTIIITANPFPITEQDLKIYFQKEKLEQELSQSEKELKEKEEKILPLEREVADLEERVCNFSLESSKEPEEKKTEIKDRLTSLKGQLKSLRAELGFSKAVQKFHKISARYDSKKFELEQKQERLGVEYRAKREAFEVRFLPS